MPTETTPTRKIEGSELAIGDSLEFLGKFYLIDRFEEASEITKDLVGDPGARFAYSGKWGITVHAGQYLDVIRVP